MTVRASYDLSCRGSKVATLPSPSLRCMALTPVFRVCASYAR